MTANDRSKYLHALVRRGLELFPIAPGRKHPPLVRFSRVASRDPEQIRAWWAEHPDANIGVHCKGLLVLDDDTAGIGVDSLRLHGDLPATFTVQTPSGGRHFYYSTDRPVANSVNRLAPGMDVRSAKGYVLAPGSVVDGEPYKVVDKSPIAPAPGWLIDLAGIPSLKERREIGTDERINPDRAAERARAWLALVSPAIEGQGGNALTYATICKIRDFGVPKDQAAETLSEWNDRCEPPWAPDELARLIDNSYRYAQNEPGVEAVETMFEPVEGYKEGSASGDTTSESEPEKDKEKEKGEKPRGPKPDEELYGPDDVDLDDVLYSDYLIKGWLNAQTLGLMFGHFGAGKTFLALHMAACLAAGQEWFDNRVKQTGVLYFGYEGRAALGRRLYAIRQEYPEWDLEKFMVRPMNDPLVTANNHDQKTAGQTTLEIALRTYAGRFGEWPGLVIIDPLRNALGGSDSDPALTAPYLAYMSRLAEITKATILTVHHPGHGEQTRSRGDSAIEAFMDTVLKIDPDRSLIAAAKQRDEAEGEVSYHLKVVTLGVDQDGDDRTTCVAQPVDLAATSDDLPDAVRAGYDALVKMMEGDLETPITAALWKAANPDGMKASTLEANKRILIQKKYLRKENRKLYLAEYAPPMFDGESQTT